MAVKSLRVLQAEVAAWSWHNFPNNKPYQPLLGVVEEVGELAHAHLKYTQAIRDYDQNKLIVETEDAIGDIVIYLADYCQRTGIDFYDAVWKTWEQVQQRDWKKYPVDGRTH